MLESSFDKEHVTTFLKNYKNIKRINISNDKDLSHLKDGRSINLKI